MKQVEQCRLKIYCWRKRDWQGKINNGDWWVRLCLLSWTAAALIGQCVTVGMIHDLDLIDCRCWFVKRGFCYMHKRTRMKEKSHLLVATLAFLSIAKDEDLRRVDLLTPQLSDQPSFQTNTAAVLTTLTLRLKQDEAVNNDHVSNNSTPATDVPDDSKRHRYLVLPHIFTSQIQQNSDSFQKPPISIKQTCISVIFIQ